LLDIAACNPTHTNMVKGAAGRPLACIWGGCTPGEFQEMLQRTVSAHNCQWLVLPGPRSGERWRVHPPGRSKQSRRLPDARGLSGNCGPFSTFVQKPSFILHLFRCSRDVMCITMMSSSGFKLRPKQRADTGFVPAVSLIALQIYPTQWAHAPTAWPKGPKRSAQTCNGVLTYVHLRQRKEFLGWRDSPSKASRGIEAICSTKTAKTVQGPWGQYLRAVGRRKGKRPQMTGWCFSSRWISR